MARRGFTLKYKVVARIARIATTGSAVLATAVFFWFFLQCLGPVRIATCIGVLFGWLN